MLSLAVLLGVISCKQPADMEIVNTDVTNPEFKSHDITISATGVFTKEEETALQAQVDALTDAQVAEFKEYIASFKIVKDGTESMVFDKETKKVTIVSNGTRTIVETLAAAVEHAKEQIESIKDFRDRLYTPTFIQKIDDLYFIVDCWHHRIIYSDTVERPIGSWNTLDENIGGPHSIAGNGDFLIADNTGYNSIKVFKRDRKAGGYYFHQEIFGIGSRPHRTEYCPQTEMFYVLGSQSTDLYCFKIDEVSDKIILHSVKNLDFLNNTYTRSFRIIDDKMYFVSGNNKIVVTTYQDEQFTVISEYPVPNELASMNDIYKKDDWFFITVTPQKLVRVQNLKQLENSEYIDMYENYDFKGTPYYFSEFDEYTYLPEISQYSSITRFKIKDGEFFDFERLHDFGAPSKESIERKKEFKM